MRRRFTEMQWLATATIAAAMIVIGVALRDLMPGSGLYMPVESSYTVPSAVGAALFVLILMRQLYAWQRRPALDARGARRRLIAVVAVATVVGIAPAIGWTLRVTLNYLATGEEEVLASVCEPYAAIAAYCDEQNSGDSDSGVCARFTSQRGGGVAHWPRKGVCPDYAPSFTSMWVRQPSPRDVPSLDFGLSGRHSLNGAWLQMTGRTERSFTPSLGAAAAWGVYRNMALLLFLLSLPFATRLPLRFHPSTARIRFAVPTVGALGFAALMGEAMVAWYLGTQNFRAVEGNSRTMAVITLVGIAATFFVLRRRRFSRVLHLAWPLAVFGTCLFPVIALQHLLWIERPMDTEGAWIATISTVVLLALSPLLMAVNERIRVLPE